MSITYVYIIQSVETLSFPHRRPHEVFGDVKKLITQEFVKQLYLECDKVPKSEPPVFDFSWGPRALQELRKRSCLELVSEVTTLKVHFVVQRVNWRHQKPLILRSWSNNSKVAFIVINYSLEVHGSLFTDQKYICTLLHCRFMEIDRKLGLNSSNTYVNTNQ